MSTLSCCSRAALGLALLVLAGCPREKENAEAYAARNAVVRYNQALVPAFQAARAELLAGVATSDEISRVVAVISGLASRGQYMVARQTRFEVVRTTIGTTDAGAATATLEAIETWTYEHRSLEAKDKPAAPKTMEYRLIYRLKPEAGGWIIDEVEEKSATAGGKP